MSITFKLTIFIEKAKPIFKCLWFPFLNFSYWRLKLNAAIIDISYYVFAIESSIQLHLDNITKKNREKGKNPPWEPTRSSHAINGSISYMSRLQRCEFFHHNDIAPENSWWSSYYVILEACPTDWPLDIFTNSFCMQTKSMDNLA